MFTVFFIPFAGGYKYSYKPLEKYVPDRFKFHTLELPGRGVRSHEELLVNLDEMADDILRQIAESKAEKYALFGHSLGAFIAWLVAQKAFSAQPMPAPLHLFLSGSPAPATQLQMKEKKHLLPKNDFIESISLMDEFSDQLLKNEGLVDYFEPILRADFTALETYQYTSQPPLPVGITLINGTQDEEITPHTISAWQQESLIENEVIFMEGRHFYIFQHLEEIVRIIKKKLIKYLSHE